MSQVWERHEVAVVGVGATRQGDHPDRDAYLLALDAFRDALADAGIADRHRIDGVLTSRQLSGIDPVQFCRMVGMNPRVTGDLDYSTGGFLTQYAAMLVATGTCEMVACVYGRNLQGSTGKLCGIYDYDFDRGLVNANAVFAIGWSQYRARYGAGDEVLGHVAIAAHRHAGLNPIAAWPEPLTMEQYLADPYVVWPLRSWDIARVTAGGIALIFTRREIARDLAKTPVYLHAVGRQQAPRLYENDDQLLCRGMRSAAAQAYGAAGIRPGDIDALFVSDASSAAIIHTLENYGFCAEGEASDFVRDRGIEIGGKLPVNTSGGQLGEGYLVGWLQHAELVRQLRGECGDRQVAGAKVAQYCATGRQREDFLTSIYVTE
ncbi:MAG TPA: thiolase family protein [Ramlibacter sp.]|jgi:acetyl-CoA acetyltransferase|nr:thiolase family protein [Ramlibacter sp.]